MPKSEHPQSVCQSFFQTRNKYVVQSATRPHERLFSRQKSRVTQNAADGFMCASRVITQDIKETHIQRLRVDKIKQYYWLNKEIFK